LNEKNAENASKNDLIDEVLDKVEMLSNT